MRMFKSFKRMLAGAVAAAAVALAGVNRKGQAPLNPAPDITRWLFPSGIGFFRAKMTPKEWLARWMAPLRVFHKQPIERGPTALRYDEIQRRRKREKRRFARKVYKAYAEGQQGGVA